MSHSRPGSLLAGTLGVLGKDLRAEFRTRYALSAVLVFAAACIAVVGYVLQGQSLNAEQAAAFLWIVVLFSSVSGLARPFVQETESGTALLLRQAARPEAVWLGKLLFNLALTALVVALVFPLGAGFLMVEVPRPGLLAVVAALGAVSLAGCATIISAMVAGARSSGSVFAVAALPVLWPALVFLVQATLPCLDAGRSAALAAGPVKALVSYTGIIMVLSWVLFPYVWEE